MDACTTLVNVPSSGDAISTQSFATCQMCIPFATEKQAEIVYNALRIDKEPKRSNVEKKLSLAGRNLQVHFVGKEARSIRTAVNAFFELLLLSMRTIERFGNSRS